MASAGVTAKLGNKALKRLRTVFGKAHRHGLSFMVQDSIGCLTGCMGGFAKPGISLFNQSSMRILLHRLAFDSQYQRHALYSGFLLYAMTIIIGSIPGARSEVGEYATGWVLHSLLYAVLTLLLFRGFYANPLRTALKTFLYVCAMGALDEYIQSFFPYRSGNPVDWLVDINAAFLMSTLLYFAWPRYALTLKKM